MGQEHTPDAAIRIIWAVEPQRVPPQDLDAVKAAVRDWIYQSEVGWPIGTSHNAFVPAAGLEMWTSVEIARDDIGRLARITTCEIHMDIDFVWDAVSPEGVPAETWENVRFGVEAIAEEMAPGWEAGEFTLGTWEGDWQFEFDCIWAPEGETPRLTIENALAGIGTVVPEWSAGSFNENVPVDLRDEIESMGNDWIREQYQDWSPGERYEHELDVAGSAFRITILTVEGENFYTLIARVEQVVAVE